MIQTPTVFILGAGASQPFGFPSGLQLCELLAAPDLDSGLTEAHDALIRFGYSDQEVRRFAKALRLSGRLSVDAFLEHRPEFLEIGKGAIAAALIPHERPFALFRRGNGASLYDYLWSQLNAKPKDFPRNRVAFITFNYDRSLEQYLSTALANAYALPEWDAHQLVRSLSINHLHGVLGNHPAYDDARVRDYSHHMDRPVLDLAAGGIRVIHEQADDDIGFTNARITLQQFERVVFLGFGYDPINLSRLFVRAIPQSTAKYRSGFGLTELQQSVVKSAFEHGIVLGGREQDALTFMRECVPLT